MKVVVNIATIFIVIIVLAAVFRQVGCATSWNWLCSAALAAESASTRSNLGRMGSGSGRLSRYSSKKFARLFRPLAVRTGGRVRPHRREFRRKARFRKEADRAREVSLRVAVLEPGLGQFSR